MRMRFLANAGVMFEHNSFNLLCDPWLTEGIYDGSWYHYPKLNTFSPATLPKIDALYISHIHPDHCDIGTLTKMSKNVPVIIYRHKFPFLKNVLTRLGFSKIYEISEGQYVDLQNGPRLFLYGPFSQSRFTPNKVPNFVDSSLVIKWDGFTILNANDNVPTVETPKLLRATHGEFDLALLQYSGAASSYPDSFENMSHQEKLNAAERKSRLYLERLCETAKVLQPIYAMPYAGEFVYGGRNWRKNMYLADPTLEHTLPYVCETVPEVKFFRLREGGAFKVDSGIIESGEWKGALDIDAAKLAKLEYAKNFLAHHKFTYELDFKVSDYLRTELLPLMRCARKRLWEYQKRLDFFMDYDVIISTGKAPYYEFNFAHDAIRETNSEFPVSKPFIRMRLDYSYLLMLLTRHAWWENAYIGAHIEFYREPDQYKPEVYSLMSFFTV